MTRGRKKMQMQLNFGKQNLKSCNGSLRFINDKFFYAILCVCYNLMQFNFSYFKKHEIAIKH